MRSLTSVSSMLLKRSSVHCSTLSTWGEERIRSRKLLRGMHSTMHGPAEHTTCPGAGRCRWNSGASTQQPGLKEQDDLQCVQLLSGGGS